MFFGLENHVIPSSSMIHIRRTIPTIKISFQTIAEKLAINGTIEDMKNR
jgi:hypothetical protein